MPAERPRAHTLTRREHRKQAPQEKFQAAREANTGTVVALENELGRLRARDEEARTRMRQPLPRQRSQRQPCYPGGEGHEQEPQPGRDRSGGGECEHPRQGGGHVGGRV